MIPLISEEYSNAPILGNQTRPALLFADNLATASFTGLAHP
jgi:hypothetical protein